MKAREKLNSQIVSMVENIEKPEWKQPWISRGKCNFVTGHAYHGGNAAYVSMVEDTFFMTFKQASEIGHVKKGEKSIPIEYYTMVKDRENPDKLRPVLTAFYNVFGLSQIEIEDAEKYEAISIKRHKTFHHENRPDIEALLDSIGVSFAYDPARAFYRAGGNTVYIPKKDQFETAEAYYRTCFHEIGHWTGLELKREFSSFGSPKYAKEELVAEIFSIYVSEDYGIDGNKESANYLKSWLVCLKNDPNEIRRAFCQAEKAYNLIVEKIK